LKNRFLLSLFYH